MEREGKEAKAVAVAYGQAGRESWPPMRPSNSSPGPNACLEEDADWRDGGEGWADSTAEAVRAAASTGTLVQRVFFYAWDHLGTVRIVTDHSCSK